MQDQEEDRCDRGRRLVRLSLITAADGQNGAVDVGRRVRGEEDDGPGLLPQGPVPLEQARSGRLLDDFAELFLFLLSLGSRTSGNPAFWCFGAAGCGGHDPHTRLGGLHSQ